MTAGLDLAIATSDPREYEQTKQLGVLISSAVAAAKGATVEDQQGVEWATAVLGELLDLSAVPREFLLINKKVVDEAIAAGVREVAGLHIFQRDDLVVRS